MSAGMLVSHTYSLVEPHTNHRVPMAFVLSGAIAKLGHPAFGTTVSRTGVHEAVDYHHAYNCVSVTFHSLQTDKYLGQQSPPLN